MAQTGEIWVATWGYEQTNATFFQIVGITPKGIKVRKIKSKEISKDNESMTGYAVPVKNAFEGEQKTRRIYLFDGEERFNAGDSYGSAEKWDGNPVAISWYG